MLDGAAGHPRRLKALENKNLGDQARAIGDRGPQPRVISTVASSKKQWDTRQRERHVRRKARQGQVELITTLSNASTIGTSDCRIFSFTSSSATKEKVNHILCHHSKSATNYSNRTPPPTPFAVKPIGAFYVFFAANLLAALYAPIQDCDETFNYWEPTHFVSHGYGLETWEYSPDYAIRSWLYIGLHAIIGNFRRILPYPTKVCYSRDYRDSNPC